MKIDELISELEQLKEEHGNLEVTITNINDEWADVQKNHFDVKKIQTGKDCFSPFSLLGHANP